MKCLPGFLIAIPLTALLLAVVPVAAQAAPTGRPNVVLYVIDTLRADHVGAYGYQRETTPNIDQWVEGSALFTRAQATAPWTKPSMVSVLTSLYPPTHQLWLHGVTLDESVPTMATLLRDAGYRTWGATSNPFTGRESDLDRGFDQFLEPRDVTDAYPGLPSSAALQRVAEDWLASSTGAPFFLFLHSMDPHMPYRPTPPYNRKWANPAEDAETRQWAESLSRIRRSGGGMLACPTDCVERNIPAETLKQRLIDRYDGEIAQNDAQFQRLLDLLRDKGLTDNTLIVLLSDHGEAFFEHGWTSHGTNLYAEELHVLLAIGGAGVTEGGRRIASTVSLVDVLPTVLEMVDVAVPEGLQGESLLPLIQGRKMSRPAFAIQEKERMPAKDCPPRNDTSVAVVTDDWKFIVNKSDPETIELYGARDVVDASNVAVAHPGVVRRLRKRLDAWRAAQELASDGVKRQETVLDEETRRQLEALGYLR